MTIGKLDRLGEIVDRLLENPQRGFSSCVVTNERGMIIVAKTVDGSSDQTLAAMVSLLSSTAERVNSNLGIEHPKLTLIKSVGVTLSVREFMVNNRWFRLGAILTQGNNGRFSFNKRRMNPKKAEATLEKATVKLRGVLEGS